MSRSTATAVAVLRSAPIRWLTLGLVYVSRALMRLVSKARALALFPDAPSVVCHVTVQVKCPENVRLGYRVVIGPKTTLGAASPITLGDYVRISEGVLIETAGLDFTKEPPFHHVHRPITIGHGVWIGARAIVLGGVTVGEESVVGAGAVVTRDVPARSVVTGAPVRHRPIAFSPSHAQTYTRLT